MLISPVPFSPPLTVYPYPDDHVTYTVGQGKRQTRVCYSEIMSQLGEATISCESHHQGESRLSEQSFATWIELCRQNHLIPFCVSTWTSVDGNHHLLMPVDKSYRRPRGFATLCCFRWADSFPGMVWQMVEHVKLGVHFWQALHYGCAKWFKNVRHSFMRVDKNHVCNGSLNFAQSVAAKVFFSSPKVRERYNNYHISDHILSYAGHIGQMTVRSVRDLLETDLAVLYDMVGDKPITTADRQKLQDTFGEIMGNRS